MASFYMPVVHKANLWPDECADVPPPKSCRAQDALLLVPVGLGREVAEQRL